jgi:hypothetical protein
MKAAEFMARYDVTGRAEPLAEVLTETSTGPAGRHRFSVTFSYPDRNGVARSKTFTYEARGQETAGPLDLGFVLRTVAETAFYGQDYDDLLDQFGTDVAITREQWEVGEHATRVLCEAWITDPRMWEDFLHLEPDTDETDSTDAHHGDQGDRGYAAAADDDGEQHEIDTLYAMMNNAPTDAPHGPE